MKEIIQEVIDLDKKTRNKVELLQKEKDHIPEFLLQEKERIEKEEKDKAIQKINQTKKRIEEDIKTKKEKAQKEFEDTHNFIDEMFDKNEKKWIDEIYDYCVNK